MSELLTGSLCYTDIVEQAKAGHSAFSRGKNGKVYFNIAQWVNDSPDQFGNTVSIQLNSTKEKRDAEGKVFIGNAKPMKTNNHQSTPQVANVANANFDDDLPF